ncbi:hypothetical protein [Arenibaculum sp.]|uniref:hypothetical protein n=1 Tax=Arenibaculum sp. TaxID=2865862 RepID=UPI002E13F563|nr:hypothetical protein [Arenibaculum sp.]
MTLDLPALRMRLLPLLLAVMAAVGASTAGAGRTDGPAQPELSSGQATERAVAVRLAERNPRALPPGTPDDGRYAHPVAGPAMPAPAPVRAATPDAGHAPGAGHATPRFPTGPPSGLPSGTPPA